MAEHVESVKQIADFLRENAGRNTSPETKQKLTRYATTLDDVAAELVRFAGLTSALPPDLGNIHDLPQELLDELSVAKTDEIEDQIVTVINSFGGDASLDQILVGLYRKFKVSQKRRFLMNKLYRMSMVWSVDGKKGVYTTRKPPLAETEVQDEALREGDQAGGTSTDNMDDEIPF